jgi:hypothetical protein
MPRPSILSLLSFFLARATKEKAKKDVSLHFFEAQSCDRTPNACDLKRFQLYMTQGRVD